MTAATNNLESGNVANYIAGGAIPAGSCVKYHSVEGQVVVTTAITDYVVGVALITAASGDQVSIQTSGVAKVIASGTCTIAVGVMPGASGKCLSEAGATAVSFGIAEQTVTADGTFLRVRLLQSLRSPLNV